MASSPFVARVRPAPFAVCLRTLDQPQSLMAAGLVDLVQVTLFPVITGQTGVDPIFAGGADFDLDLIESRTLDGHTQEFVCRPTPHA